MSYNFIMLFGTGGLNLFGNRLPDRQMNFDINLLPMNLSEGRNIGELSGLFLYTAPKKVESSRQADVFIVLFYVDNLQITESRMRTWANILADTYYTARGSFTMGMASAIKKLAAYLAKENKGQIMPVIYMNTAVLRDRSLMIAHAGPVHTTVISSDKVQNFNDETCLPIQITHNELSFFTADVHSEDIILLCPKVPNDWTNTAIMEVTGDSPLNAIRFLLDRSGGNLQAAVIQLKSGKGQISFKSKTKITANVQNDKHSNKNESGRKRNSSNLIDPFENETALNEIPIERPLIRQRKSMELFDDENKKDTEQPDNEDVNNSSEDTEANKTDEETKVSLTGDNALPDSENLPYDFTEDDTDKKTESSDKSLMRKKSPGNQSHPISDSSNKNQKPQKKSKRKFNAKRFILILVCGLLIPIFVVSVLFFIYSGRSKNQLHEEYLTLGVAAAQKAIETNSLQNKETLWTESLSYAEQALSYGNSQAARDLRKQAMANIDQINGGISTVYNYANQSKLPQGLNIVEIATSGQFTYALDSTSGSVLRFSASGNGLSLDSNFTCSPGIYKQLEKTGEEEENTENKDIKTVKINPLVGFFTLPAGNPHGFVLAGIDADANILYCTGNKNNRAAEMIKPNTRNLTVSSVYFSNNSLYILDAPASTIWEYLFNNSEGFIYEPSNYYGSYTPFLSDIIDFAMFKEYSYFLRNNGTLLVCDYTSYRPDCQEYTNIQNEDRSVYVGFQNHHFKKILVNSSPDNSIYIMDEKLQSVLNLSVKMNYIRYIVPNRNIDEISQYSKATGFGITGQNRLLWSYQNDLYIANMP